MSRPRQAFGRQPGRLGATMLRALCAELSDSGRYSRAKRYAADGAVVEIDVRGGVVDGEVLGSRRYPYEVSIAVDAIPAGELQEIAASGVPTLLIPEPHELAVRCTCPDADGVEVCKHALALILVLADEISIEPELLGRWRSGDVHRRPGGTRPPARSFELRQPEPTAAPSRQRIDAFAPLLRAPHPIGELPDFGSLIRPELRTPPAAADDVSRLLDDVLADAIDAVMSAS